MDDKNLYGGDDDEYGDQYGGVEDRYGNPYNEADEDKTQEPAKKLKVMVVTQRVNPVVQAIAKQSVELVGIVESAPRFYDVERFLSRAHFRFWLMSILRPEKNLSLFARIKKIPYLLLHDGSQDLLDVFVRDLEPDLIIVYSMSQLLPESVFKMPRLGTVNLHPSLLPSYRGADPWFWVYHGMEPENGVTLHFVDKNEDTGDIIYQSKFTMPLGIPLNEAREASAKAAAGLALRLIKDLNKGYAIDSYPQSEKSPTPRARRVKVSEYPDLINIKEWPVERVWHMLNGMPDWIRVVRPKGGFLARMMRWHLTDYSTARLPADRDVLAGTVKRVGAREYVLYCRDGRIGFFCSVHPVNMLKGLLGLS